MTLLTPAQLAKKYPVSRSALYSAMQDGLLPFYRLPSKRGSRGKYLVKEEDFLAWLEANRHEGGAAPPSPPPPLPVVTPPRLRHVRVNSP